MRMQLEMELTKLDIKTWLLSFRDVEELIDRFNQGSRIEPEIEIRVSESGLFIGGELLTWSEIDLAKQITKRNPNQTRFL